MTMSANLNLSVQLQVNA